MRSAATLVALGLVATHGASEAGDISAPWEGGPTIRIEKPQRSNPGSGNPNPTNPGADGPTAPAAPSFGDQQHKRVSVAEGRRASKLGLEAYKKKRLDEAVKLLDVAVRAGVESAATLAHVQNARGVELFESASKERNATIAQRKYRDGRVLVERALAADPNNARYRDNLAEMHDTWCGRHAKLVPPNASDDWFSTTAGAIYLGHVERAQAAGWKNCRWYPDRGDK